MTMTRSWGGFWIGWMGLSSFWPHVLPHPSGACMGHPATAGPSTTFGCYRIQTPLRMTIFFANAIFFLTVRAVRVGVPALSLLCGCLIGGGAA